MDRKSIIILIISGILILGWSWLGNMLYPPKTVVKTNTVATATSQIGTNVAAVPSTTTTTTTATTTNAPAFTGPEQTITVTNEEAVYTFSSRGGGLKLVELLRYPAIAGCGVTNLSTNAYASLNTDATLPVLAILGADNLTGDGNFQLSNIPGGVRAEKHMPNGLSVVKDFQFGSNYLVTAKVHLQNQSHENVVLPPQQWVIGTATPMNTRDAAALVGFYVFDGNKAKSTGMDWFRPAGSFACRPSPPKNYFEQAGKIAWADVHNQFFTLITVPSTPADKIQAQTTDLPNAREIVAANKSGVTNGIQTMLVYPSSVLATNQVLERNFTFYAGPKEYRRIAQIGSQIKTDLDPVMGFGFFGFFAKLLLLSMNGLHSLFGNALNYGWIIILITVLIKVVFWPLTAASTRSMKRMQAFQPQIAAMKEKYKDDPAKLQRKQMEFWREHKINPMSGCLPVVIQIPVFFGFLAMINGAIELRGVHFLWACDLSQPDTVAYLGGFAINILPIIYGVSLLYQARIMPVAPGADPSQAQMMKYMPLLFLGVIYNRSAALTLYWTVQNLLTIVQTRMTRTTDDTAKDGKTPVQIIPPKKKK